MVVKSVKVLEAVFWVKGGHIQVMNEGWSRLQHCSCYSENAQNS